ncbi:AAA+-type ATPase, SpoVK/Ycf46/Vps4 family [Geosmithia morbida]|uniref:AAA+-type ATPase, SpoVK/Ycf46/Vps4 family n=1 Tax=Geosmithia morbida TaxID=1094350 RepID=A0A9P4YRU4_9HYPO|nr:AAA+-type ATPase, SpoVK/Ycf46/Vps4 family [Geosmithia morbida]KAF4121575.1 AAA+-type ATPase, SpoVK/Ycf46/Vps4 family [Geosmithia morbida]
MSRNKALTLLQKTYDDSYLSCSTAVYHESQGNELEAMRHWQDALDQIYDHNANKVLPMYTPRSDTEKALIDALKQLELQCKERIDLLQALKASMEDSSSVKASGKLSKTTNPYKSNLSSHPRGSIGQGTIPAVSYSDLSRPSLPHRPALPPRPAAEPATPSSSYNSSHHSKSKTQASPLQTSKHPSLARPSDENSPSRTQSPERYTMRTTLRSGTSGDKHKNSRKSPKPVSEGPSKAATLAWSTLNSREKGRKSTVASPDYAASQAAAQRSSLESPRRFSSQLLWDSHSRRLVSPHNVEAGNSGDVPTISRYSDEHIRPSNLSVSAASSALTSSHDPFPSTPHTPSGPDRNSGSRSVPATVPASKLPRSCPQIDGDSSYEPLHRPERRLVSERLLKTKDLPRPPIQSPRSPSKKVPETANRSRRREPRTPIQEADISDDDGFPSPRRSSQRERSANVTGNSMSDETSDESQAEEIPSEESAWKKRKDSIIKSLPPGVDEAAAKQILNDVVVQGDEVHWDDVAGLDVAKAALREAVVYPFLRPDLFMGLREPARGMLLFGPPGTGKTMLARAVATESRSTFFSISASSLTSKFLGESEKLVRALFGLAKILAPSIIFVDEIDSLLSQRSGSGEHEATRRIKTEFLIQWSDLQRAAAGRETTEKDRERGDANRVLVLAATNLPWAIDEAARRRFVRRQYIPLPEPSTRETQLRTLLGQQKHSLSNKDIAKLVDLTDGSDVTALAKDAAMGPLRSLGDALLHMTMDDIRPISLLDFERSLKSIRPSVSKSGLKEYEDWARDFGERGG